MMNNKRITNTLALLGLTVALLSACSTEEQANSDLPEVPKNVRVLTLRNTDLEEYFEISGPVAPVRGTDLSAQESGAVIALPISKGEVVKAGDLIIEQDRAILKAEMQATQSALASQEYNNDKVKQLFDADKVSKIELLHAETAFAQAKGMADISRKRYERAGIKAPFGGILADRFVELGQLVSPGQKVVRIIDPFTLKMNAYMTDTQVRWVNKGDSAVILLGTNPEPVMGTVTWIGMEADRMTGKFQVELEIANADMQYNSGVIGRARLEKNMSSSVITVPRDAVVSGRAGPAVYVVNDNRSHLRQITLGRDQGLMVIVASGLKAGDKVVVRGQRDLREGNLVKISETATNVDGSIKGDPMEVKESDSGSRVPGAGSRFGQ